MPPVLPSIVLTISTAIGNVSPAELEKAYWDCEFAATQGAIDLNDAAICSEIYEHLKGNKFLGDFDRFLVWWKENKEREMSSRMMPPRYRGDR